MSDFAAFPGIDLITATTQQKEFSTLKHTPEALQDVFLDLRRRFDGQPIAVAVEQARGPLLFALLKYEFLTFYPIHPTMLARYREAFSPSRAKMILPIWRLRSRVAVSARIRWNGDCGFIPWGVFGVCGMGSWQIVIRRTNRVLLPTQCALSILIEAAYVIARSGGDASRQNEPIDCVMSGLRNR